MLTCYLQKQNQYHLYVQGFNSPQLWRQDNEFQYAGHNTERRSGLAHEAEALGGKACVITESVSVVMAYTSRYCEFPHISFSHQNIGSSYLYVPYHVHRTWRWRGWGGVKVARCINLYFTCINGHMWADCIVTWKITPPLSLSVVYSSLWNTTKIQTKIKCHFHFDKLK